MNWEIYLSPPHMGGDEIKFINEAFDANWIAPLGPNVDNFEIDLKDYIGVKSAAALSSGTAALHLALILLGVERDDEVICQSFTFCGTVNPVIYQGAVPVFIDSETDTWNMDPELLEEAILDRQGKGKLPKAIILVHLYGMPAKMNELLKIAAKYKIPVIEDAAEALGSTYLNKKCGSMGDFSVLSFNGNKIITTSGGGALLGNDPQMIERAKFLATQARDPAPHYQHSTIGYNYRLSNISAGIGRGQMRMINERVEKRRQNYTFYKNRLKDISEISFLKEPEGFFSNRWLTTLQIDSQSVDREQIRLTLLNKKIEARPLWKPLHLQPVYQKYPTYLNGISEKLFASGLCLPSGSGLDEEQLEKISQIVISCFK